MSSVLRVLAGSAATVVALAVASVPAAGAPLPLATVPAAVTAVSTYSGYSSGTGIFVDGVDVDPAVATLGLAQAGAAVASGTATLTTADALTQPLAAGDTVGKSGLGHAAALNLGLLADPADQPAVQETLAEATSPGASQATSDQLLAVPVAPVATADLLPGAAAASTAADGSCVTDGPLSTGAAHAANARVLMATADPLIMVGGSVDSVSETRLVPGAGTAGLVTSTVETVAPITLFAGTPAATTLTVLAPLTLSTTSTGLPGGSTVSYAAEGVGPTDPLVTITAAGMTTTLTSQDVFGNGGVVLSLGVLDVTIGTPVHALGGLEGTSPVTTVDGTTTSAEADLVRITANGRLTGPSTVDGPLAGVLNPVVTPLTAALAPLTSPLRDALAAAGLDAADVRIAHLESTATVPVGGIVCPQAAPAAPAVVSPFTENYKDVSALTAAPGQTFTYLVRFPNRGTADATDVVVTDTYAAGLELVDSVPAATSASGSTATFDVGTVAAGAVATVTLTFRVPADAAAGTVYSNQATITGVYGGDPTSDRVDVSGPTVAVPTEAGCVLRYSTMYASNTQVVTGESFDEYVNVLDSGTGPCDGVTVVEPLPAGTTFVSCSQPCSFDGSTITWTVGTLQPGQSTVVAVTLRTTATEGSVPGTATVSANNGSPVTVSTPDPQVTSTSVGRPGEPAGCRTACPAAVRASRPVLAETGLAAWPVAAGLALLAGGAFVRRRRV